MLKEALKTLINWVTDGALDKVKVAIEDRTEWKVAEKRLDDTLAFNKDFDNTELDSKSFSDYLTSDAVMQYFRRLYFDGEKDDLKLEELVNGAVEKINAYRKSHDLEEFSNYSLVNTYFQKTSESLHDERLAFLTVGQRFQNAELVQQLLIALKKDEWKIGREDLASFNQVAINQLGERYSPEINIRPGEVGPIDAIFQNDTFVNQKDLLVNSLITNFNDLKKLNPKLGAVQKCTGVQNIRDVYSILEFIERELEKENSFIEQWNHGSRTQRKEPSSENRERIKRYYRVISSVGELQELLSRTQASVFDEPYLVVVGPAGIGKSHLLADSVVKYQDDHPILFTLGENFTSGRTPILQIIDSLGEPFASPNSFLASYADYAHSVDKRAFIVIDALNETQPSEFWKQNLGILVNQVKKYDNLGIILSIRNTFYRDVVTDDFFQKNSFQEYYHPGLTNLESQHIELLETKYNLTKNELQRIYPEFSNPLFLKMAALSGQDSEHTLDWENVLLGYLNFLEKEIAKKFNYQDFLIVDLLQRLAMLMFERGKNSLPIKTVRGLIKEKLDEEYLNEIKVNDFMNSLTSRGIVRQVKRNGSKLKQPEVMVYFNFERVKDLLVVEGLLSKSDDEDYLTDLISELVQTHEYGILETLLFLIPNQNHPIKEVLELVNVEDFKNGSVREAVLNSLLWRKKGLNGERANKIVNALLVSVNPRVATRFFRYQMMSATNIVNPFNANWLTEQMLKFSNAYRELFLTEQVSAQLSSVALNLANDVLFNFSDRSQNVDQWRLAAKELIWMLATVNIELRDVATKALYVVFREQPGLINEMLDDFSEVDDRYVVERLYAAVLGSVLFLDAKEMIMVAKNVYKHIFYNQEIIPHVQIRDFARQIIEYVVRVHGEIEGVQMDVIRPPYNSPWYDYEISNTDVDNFVKQVESYDERVANVLRTVVYSMTTEYGRGSGSYGDFGRYVFESRLRPWENQFDIQMLSNVALDRMFALGLNLFLHSKFDSDIGYKNPNPDRKGIERISKKYQWIALQEVHAKIADNFQVFEEEVLYDDEYNEYFKTPPLLYNEEVSVDEMISSLQERQSLVQNFKMIPEDHEISRQKKNEHFYELGFYDFVREIDPTTFDLTSLPINKVRAKSVFDVSGYDNLFFLNLEGKRYIALDLDVVERSDDENQMKLLYGVVMFNSMDVSNNAKEELHIGPLEAPRLTGMYLHELYWSDMYKSYESEMDEYDDEKYTDHASNVYVWEDDRGSEVQVTKVRVPSKKLVAHFGLKLINNSKWINEQNDLIAFDGIFVNGTNALWFDFDKLKEYLQATDSEIIWKAFLKEDGRRVHETIWRDEKTWNIIEHEG